MLFAICYSSLSGRPAILRQRLICVASSVPAAPALGGPELLHVVVVITEQRAGRLDVARARELQLEADTLLIAPAAQLVHLLAQGLRALGGLGRLRDLALELRDARVALLQSCLVVRARLGDAAICSGARVTAHLR
uniref:hypothetical protein n=1 Tax=Olsenella timonensis TaxID=1805478 RepID=UPI0011C6F40E|nr:hypothetical protein [Olsenella timonensis]